MGSVREMNSFEELQPRFLKVAHKSAFRNLSKNGLIESTEHTAAAAEVSR